MAKMEMVGFETDDFLNIKSEDVYIGCLEAAAPILEESMKKTISSVIRHKDRSSGDLVRSIKKREPKKDKYGNYFVFVGPSGNSKKIYYHTRKGKRSKSYTLSNAAKLIWMEYGSFRQTTTPVLAKSTNDARENVYQKMQTEFDERIEG